MSNDKLIKSNYILAIWETSFHRDKWNGWFFNNWCMAFHWICHPFQNIFSMTPYYLWISFLSFSVAFFFCLLWIQFPHFPESLSLVRCVSLPSKFGLVGEVWSMLTVSMLKLLLSMAEKCKKFWNPTKTCNVGIHWKALAEYYQMSTHMPRFQSFFSFFCIILCIDQISHQHQQQPKGSLMDVTSQFSGSSRAQALHPSGHAGQPEQWRRSARATVRSRQPATQQRQQCQQQQQCRRRERAARIRGKW